MLCHKDGQLKFRDGLELQDKDFHHLDQQLFSISALLLTALSDTLYQVEQELTAHRLYGGWQRLIMDILA